MSWTPDHSFIHSEPTPIRNRWRWMVMVLLWLYPCSVWDENYNELQVLKVTYVFVVDVVVGQLQIPSLVQQPVLPLQIPLVERSQHHQHDHQEDHRPGNTKQLLNTSDFITHWYVILNTIYISIGCRVWQRMC